jgi:putative hydrolase of the HAD superfamily
MLHYSITPNNSSLTKLCGYNRTQVRGNRLGGKNIIKAIIFDFGQTLVDAANGFRKAEKEAQKTLFADPSLNLQEDFLTTYRRIRKELHDRSNFSRKSLWQEVYHFYGLKSDARLLETWETAYWETVKANSTLFPETVNVLKSLSSKYQLGMITNTQGQQRSGTHRISQFPELETYFKVIIVAGENSIPPKPDPEPFRLCLQELNLKPSEAVYVGDDYRIDVCGAKDAGLHAVWIKHHCVSRSWPEVETSVPIITHLNQLLDIERMVKVL